MRVEVSRPQRAQDAWGRSAITGFSAVETLPCFVYVRDGGLVQDEGKTASVDQLRALFPTGSDVRPEDRLGDVEDRLGSVLFRGPFRVGQPVRRERHIEAPLERHVDDAV